VESGSDDSDSSAQPHVCPGAQFTDMPKYTDWAHAGLDYCIANGMLNGTSATAIEPGSATTRAQLVTILWRQNGCPTPTRTCSFTDLTQSWYKDAVAWAAETGIVKGRDAVTFDPTAPITRQEMATMLYRYATFAKLDTSAKGDLSVFPDENQVLDYAVDAMTWANGAGLITGNVVNDVTCLDPLGNANRAQVATILMRFCENVAK
ncbi:MAG: S-layer homology domain-containing protein, partial [Oscillospiraceae bacterium]|nr:S-layer homology domain-containing protein [Oscillospiraceae bacterium]